MSRLKPLHIPFASGFSDEVDSKLLPDGVLAELRNGRVDRVGSVRLRRGWRPVDLTTRSEAGGVSSTPDAAVDLYATSRGLVALVEHDGRLALQTYVNPGTAAPWIVRSNQPVNPVTRVVETGRMADLDDDVTRVSCAVTTDGVWGAVLQQTATDAGFLRVFRIATDETRLFFTASVPTKLVSLGSSFGIVEDTGTNLRFRVFDPAAAGGTFASGVFLVATVTVDHFDAAVAVETTPTHVHLVYTVSGAVTYRKFDLAGTEVGTGKTVVASGAQAAYVASDDTTAHVVYQDSTSDELSLLTFSTTSPFTTTAGPTALNAGVAYTDGRVAIGYTPNHALGARVWVAGGTSGETATIRVDASTHALSTVVTHDSALLTSGWITRGSYAGVGLVRGAPGSRDAYYTDSDAPWVVLGTALAANPQTSSGPWAVGQNAAGDAVVAWPRRSDATASQSRAAGQIATRQASVAAFRVFDTASRRPGVDFDGALYVTGGMLTQYVATSVTENGMLRPVIDGVAAADSSGTIANGGYSYRVVVQWRDTGGRVHRSPVSDPADFTVSGSNDTVTVTVHVAKTLRRDADTTQAPVVELYRTEAGPGELFYHVASTTMDNDDDSVDVVDTLPDASILDNKRLYTEGEFGTTSGALDIAPARASAYAATTRDRVVLGSAGIGYQLSQTALPEEPVAFTDPGYSGPTALAYQDTVNEPLTAVFTMDETVVLGTATRLYVTGGEGPNLAGVGEFSSPARLPVDVGVLNASSVVEDASGVWFLGTTDRVYVLPRGQTSPSAVLSARDRFAAGTCVGAAVSVEDDLTCWAIADGADSVLVSRHAQPPNPWAVDALPFTPRALVGYGGGLYALDSVGGVWTNSADATFGDGTSGATAVALRLATADVQVFGQGGHGRLAVIEVLGTYQTDATLLVEVSYDLGLTWTAVGTAFTVSGLTAGEAFQRRWTPARQRGGKFRVRVTMTPSVTTGEGCNLTGVSLYYAVAGGPTRLPGSRRR